MKRILTISFLALVIVMAGCVTGKKALEKGYYDLAVTQAIKRLKSNDDSKKATATLKKGYNLALDTHLDEINRASASSDPMKWEIMANNYRAINNMYDAIRRCPACLDIIPNPQRYDNELSNAQMKAADERYNLGMQAMAQKENRLKALEAHEHFKVVKNMVPRYKDIDDKLDESLFFATLKVLVDPIPSPSRFLEIKHEFFVNKINEYLHHKPINEYVRFYTAEEANAQNLQFVDHIIHMEFDEFSLGNVFRENTIREIRRDSVVVGKVDGKDVIGTVEAKMKVTEIAITGGGLLDFKILDNQANKIITQEKMPSQYTWRTSWGTFEGDKRALSEEDLVIVNRTEVGPPSPQIMFEEFTAPLYDQVISKIVSYYRGF
ncbi:hypothetical protein [Marinoscillum sp. MHG1-6]|uniref:hypothetical protein n=1 Tax=Marinoscillum sp. MHG1-6 TaxID=2959627 RepID=UPI002157C123|nr:hypothetical protein [Marinoscillum sp. MHG1-6]